MSRIFRRLASTTSNPSAAEAAKEILSRYSEKPISVREQLIDSNQARLLSLALGRPSLHKNVKLKQDGDPADGTPLPPGYHWAYFTPALLEKDIGNDGTDKPVNPMPPFTRRMFAGGSFEWKQSPANLLRIGQTVKETTRITSAEPKERKSGDSMILAGLEKTFENEDGVALIDRRTWVFQREFTEKKEPPPKPEEKPFPEATHTRDFCQTDVSLFRFSGLTFNSHKIHYSREWCRSVEGHREIVVHGPVSLLGILDLYRDVNTNGDSEVVPKSITYRAMAPLYAGEKYRVLLDKDATGEGGENPEWKAEIIDSFGKTAYKATIVE